MLQCVLSFKERLASLLLSAERSFTGTSDITEIPIGMNGLSMWKQGVNVPKNV